MQLRLLSVIAGTGLGEALPHRIRVQDPGRGVTGYLSAALGQELLVSLYVGPSRAVQKPVLQLLTPSGRTFAFAKVSVNPLTRRLVAAEAKALPMIERMPRRRVVVPALLHHGQWRDHEVTVQEALTGSTRSRPDPVVLAEATVELATLFGVRSSELLASAYWQRLLARVDRLPGSGSRRTLEAAVSRLGSVAERVPLPFGSWHGDWAPWNMTQAADKLLVWDWEHLHHDVPVGFDALHHHLQGLVVTRSMQPLAAFGATQLAAPAILRPFGPETAAQAALVVVLYAMEIAVRYLEDGEVEAGTRMGRLDTWLELVMARLVDAVARRKSR